MTDDDMLSVDDIDESEKANSYITDLEIQYQKTLNKIEENLVGMRDEPASVVSVSAVAAKSKHSGKSQGSTTSRHVEIALKVQELKVAQLKERHKRERAEQELKRQNEMKTALEERASAELRAKLSMAAGIELNWDRREDFVGEPTLAENEPTTNVLPQAATAMAGTSAPPESLLGSLPRLELTKFRGTTGEWPR